MAFPIAAIITAVASIGGSVWGADFKRKLGKAAKRDKYRMAINGLKTLLRASHTAATRVYDLAKDLLEDLGFKIEEFGTRETTAHKILRSAAMKMKEKEKKMGEAETETAHEFIPKRTINIDFYTSGVDQFHQMVANILSAADELCAAAVSGAGGFRHARGTRKAIARALALAVKSNANQADKIAYWIQDVCEAFVRGMVPVFHKGVFESSETPEYKQLYEKGSAGFKDNAFEGLKRHCSDVAPEYIFVPVYLPVMEERHVEDVLAELSQMEEQAAEGQPVKPPESTDVEIVQAGTSQGTVPMLVSSDVPASVIDEPEQATLYYYMDPEAGIVPYEEFMGGKMPWWGWVAIGGTAAAVIGILLWRRKT
mgnify:CR=1 FL=1